MSDTPDRNSIYTTVTDPEFDDLINLGQEIKAKHMAEVARAAIRFTLHNESDFFDWFERTNGEAEKHA